MPANKKYLSSPGQRALKISAGLIGGYMLSTAVHLALAVVPGMGFNLLVSGTFTGFFLWAVCMVLAFLARNGWKVWAIYLCLTFILGLIAFYGGVKI